MANYSQLSATQNILDICILYTIKPNPCFRYSLIPVSGMELEREERNLVSER